MGLWGAEPYRRLAEDMGPVGKGIYWDLFEQIRLGNGIDSAEHLVTIYDGVKNRMQRESLRRKLRQVLNDYGLFNVNPQGMVTIIDYSKEVRQKNRQMLQEPDMFEDQFVPMVVKNEK